MRFSKKKFRNLVHYICAKCEDGSTLGATKLNKILWYSEVLSFVNWEKPITGEKYIKRQFGPVPKHILAALGELDSRQELLVRKVEHYGFRKTEYVSLKAPDISAFSSDEIDLIDSVIDSVCNKHTAKTISDLSHTRIWELAAIGEEIPHYAMFAWRLGEINENDTAWAKSAMERLAA